MRNFDEWFKTYTDNINNWNYLKNGIIKERFV